MKRSIEALPIRTIRKIRDDSERIKRFARFVIILDENGAVIRTIENRDGQHRHPIQPIIAILAPTIIGNAPVPETLVFEMTYDRAVPYRRIEENIGQGSVLIRVPRRHRVRMITEEELRSSWYVLEHAALSILKNRLFYWKSLGEKYWFGVGKGFYRGIFFRCQDDDVFAFREFWREHLTYTARIYRSALRKISRLKYSWYTEKQVRSFNCIRDFVEACHSLAPVERRWIFEHSGNLRGLVELIFDTFGLSYAEEGPLRPTQLLFGNRTTPIFPAFKGISAYFHRNRTRKRHAMGCFSVELLPLRHTVLQWEAERNTERAAYWDRFPAERSSSSAEREVDDIPFDAPSRPTVDCFTEDGGVDPPF